MLQVQGLITVYARPPLIFLPALPFPLLCQACCPGMHQQTTSFSQPTFPDNIWGHSTVLPALLLPTYLIVPRAFINAAPCSVTIQTSWNCFLMGTWSWGDLNLHSQAMATIIWLQNKLHLTLFGVRVVSLNWKVHSFLDFSTIVVTIHVLLSFVSVGVCLMF